MAFPSTLSSFNRPSASDKLNSPSHSALHNTVSSAVGQIEQTIGLSTTSVVGTLFYDIRSPDSNGGGHVQTANKGGTGQTAYTKGDVLVATSSSVLTKLAVGTNDHVLIADSAQAAGVKWGAVPTVNVQSFVGQAASTVTGVWNKPSIAGLASRVFVQVWAGGGSGGRGSTSGAGGGGGGAYNEGWYPASILSTSILVIVGKGAEGRSDDGDGSAGGTTVFGDVTSILSAFGGGGGRGSNGATIDGSGGGGGGITAPGQTGVATHGGDGGAPGGGSGGVTSATGAGAASIAAGFGGAGGGGCDTNTAGDATVGAFGIWGGGGGSAGTTTNLGGGGGDAQMGGAGGGGGALSSVAGGRGGGISGMGGNGGRGGIASAIASSGSIPGGGGGGSYQGASGAGGGGKVIITTFA